MALKVLDPRLNMHEYDQQINLIQKGGGRYTYQIEPADSYSTSQVNFNITPPSTRTIIDRNIRIRWFIEVTTDQPMNIGTFDALRQAPISSVIDILTVQINGTAISHTTADLLHAQLCYGVKMDDHNDKLSTFPSMPDTYQQYSDWAVYGSGKCPLKSYGENGSSIPTRAGFVVQQISPTVARFEIVEPLWMSPFNSVGKDAEGFVNVNQMNFNIRFKNSLSRVFSHDAGNNSPNITTVAVSFYKQPEMLLLYITPPSLMQLPSILSLPYHKPEVFIKQLGVINAGASLNNYNSDAYRLSQIPRQVMIFGKQSRNTQDFKSSDSFSIIKRISILWNNDNGVLNNASQQDLYNMSKRNGCCLSYPAFIKYRGSPIVLSFGNDVELKEDESPGVQGQYTFKLEVDLMNGAASNIDTELFIVFLYEGVAQIFENGFRTSLGNLTREMVLSAHENAPQLDYHSYDELQGAGFFSGFKNFINKVAGTVGQVAKFVSPVLGAIAPELAPIASTIGTVADTVKSATGGRLSGGRLSGGRLRRLKR